MTDKAYSNWYRIDLHIHTDKSKETKDNDYKGVFSVDTLHKKLLDTNVQIFSLTDHNIINVDAYEQYYNDYPSKDSPFLLLGVELDIQVDASRKYHSLLIFDISDIEGVKKISDKLENKYTALGITNKKNRIVEFKDIVELFNDYRFFFIPHAHKGDTGIVKAYQGEIEHAQKMLLLMHSALEKVPEKAIDIYNQGFSKLLNDEFKDSNDIAYINFSDNHNIGKYPCIHKGEGDNGDHIFCYVKGQKSYETLRLAFIDPKSRIKSQSEYTAINRSLVQNNLIEGLTINKSGLLVDGALIFSPHLNVIIGGRSSGKSLLLNLLGKKINEKVKDKYGIEHTSVKIKSSLDEEYKDDISLTHDYIYINQGDIVRYFEEQKLVELAEQLDKKSEYEVAIVEFVAKKDEIKRTVQDLVTAYSDCYREFSSKNFVFHKSTIDNILNPSFVFKFNYDSVYQQKNKKEQIQNSLELLNEIEENILKFQQNGLFEFEEDENSTIEEFKTLLVSKRTLLTKKELKNKKVDAFLSSVKGIIENQNSKLTDEASMKIRSSQKRDELLLGIKNKFTSLHKLARCSKTVESLDYYFERPIPLSDNITLVLETEMKEDSVNGQILDAIKDSSQDKCLYYNVIRLLGEKLTIKNLGGNSPDRLNQKLETQLKIIYNKFDKPKDFLRYKDGNTSKSNSPGYNSEKYLEIVLNNPKNKTIFIDQPEDNLGNNFISDKLVNIFRDIKFSKQILLVTHNPSIVVYGDAESIIMAVNDDNNISYEQLVLEHPEAQKKICKALDGGEYIFDNRSKKYNIQRILNTEVQ